MSFTGVPSSNRPSCPSEKVPDRFCHPSSVDLSNPMWVQKELIKQLVGDACCNHRTKATSSAGTSKGQQWKPEETCCYLDISEKPLDKTNGKPH